MKFLKKYIWILLALGIFTLYFFTRLYNILGLPIFTDEAIYVRWAQIASNDAAWRFISLTDGKQPMYVWITMLLMKIIEDPLLAGRVTSVLAGVGSMIGIFFLTSEMFKPSTGSASNAVEKRLGAWKLGILASFLYVLYPFSLVYDRMALYDSLVAMFMIWALYLEILLVRYMRLDLAMILGMVIGLGMLTKTNANFAFILLPALLLLYNFHGKNWKKNLGKLALFSLVAVAIANVMYSILRLSPFFHIIEAKNYVFIYPFSEWVKHPLTYVIPNMLQFFDWFVHYLTPPFLVLLIASFFFGKKFIKERLLLVSWFILPLLATALFGKLLYSRHILFTTMPLIVLGAYVLYEMFVLVKKVWMRILLCFVFLLMFVVNDYFIITDFEKASVPQSDKGQFIEGWPSGLGVKETIQFINEKSKNQKIYVATEGTFGLMPYALEMYFINNPNVTIKGFWPITNEIPAEVLEASKTQPTYFVYYQDCPSCVHMGMAPASWNKNTDIVFQIERVEKERYYTFYQIKAQ